MELIIVGIVVAAAVGFIIRSFVKIYRGEENCNCGGCSCASQTQCDTGQSHVGSQDE